MSSDVEKQLNAQLLDDRLSFTTVSRESVLGFVLSSILGIFLGPPLIRATLPIFNEHWLLWVPYYVLVIGAMLASIWLRALHVVVNSRSQTIVIRKYWFSGLAPWEVVYEWSSIIAGGGSSSGDGTIAWVKFNDGRTLTVYNEAGLEALEMVCRRMNVWESSNAETTV